MFGQRLGVYLIVRRLVPGERSADSLVPVFDAHLPQGIPDVLNVPSFVAHDRLDGLADPRMRYGPQMLAVQPVQPAGRGLGQVVGGGGGAAQMVPAEAGLFQVLRAGKQAAAAADSFTWVFRSPSV